MIQLPEERARRLSRLRLRVAMHRASLDAQLAGGAEPLGRPEQSSPAPGQRPATPSSHVGARRGRWRSATVLISDDPGNAQVIARRSGIRDRLLARVHADRLDRDLAAGLCPDSDLVLSIRAHRLIALDARRAIADAIGSLVRAAQEPRDSLSRRTPLCRYKIIQAAEPLHELACRLSAPGPANARGVAQARLLLTDGAGPLYLRPDVDDLAPVVRRAVGALDLELADRDL